MGNSLPPTPTTPGNVQTSKKRNHEQIRTPEHERHERQPFMNGTPCRLTPITHKFMDVMDGTGHGERSLEPGHDRNLAAAIGGSETPVFEGSSPQRRKTTTLDYSGPTSPSPTPNGFGRYQHDTSKVGRAKGWSMPKTPYKVLDAPDLVDDFYLNLVDWSSKNILGVGLGSCVYLWNAVSANVTKL
ncbi:Protein FIZZY-RELATED 2, partial [Rhizophlyctis rosea]